MDGIRLTGLWRNERDGKVHLSGSFGGGRLVVFPNDRKEGDRDPDYVVYLVPSERREADGQGRPSSSRGRGYGGPRRDNRPGPDNDFADGGRADRGDPFARGGAL